jgi:hypothetical protein
MSQQGRSRFNAPKNRLKIAKIRLLWRGVGQLRRLILYSTPVYK